MNDQLVGSGKPITLSVDINFYLQRAQQRLACGNLDDDHPLAAPHTASYEDPLSDLTELSDIDEAQSDPDPSADEYVPSENEIRRPGKRSKLSRIREDQRKGEESDACSDRKIPADWPVQNIPKAGKRPKKTRECFIRPLPAFSPSTASRVVPVLASTASSTSTPSTEALSDLTGIVPAPDSQRTSTKRKARRPKTTQEKKLQKEKKREKRRAERQVTRKETGGLKAIAVKRMKEAQVQAVEGFDVGNLPAATGAWVGKNQWFMPVRRSLADLKAANIQILPWPGVDSHPIQDCNGRTFILLGAPPRDDGWQPMNQRMGEKIRLARQRARFTKKQKYHPRGRFPVMASGYGHGGGTEEPSKCALSQTNQKVMDDLLGDADFIRVAGHNDNLFKLYNPRMHKLYADVAEVVLQHDKTLKPPFINTPFAAATVNYGPQSVTNDHVDAHNLPFGWCVVHAIGKYDPKKGGHLVLWELGIAIEFPPGCSIFLPSALLVHSNAEIMQDEERYSFTTYSAGGLFRWVFNGLQTEEDLEASMTPEELLAHKKERLGRWKESLDYFPTLL